MQQMWMISGHPIFLKTKLFPNLSSICVNIQYNKRISFIFYHFNEKCEICVLYGASCKISKQKIVKYIAVKKKCQCRFSISQTLRKFKNRPIFIDLHILILISLLRIFFIKQSLFNFILKQNTLVK